jgi:uncharacterized protein YqiB (DUF1249 family)
LLLDLALNIIIASIYYKCDIIEAIKYTTNLNSNENRNLFIKDNLALLRLKY